MTAGASGKCANYGLGTSGLLGETAAHFNVAGLTVMSSLGYDLISVRSDAFDYAGGLALSAAEYSTARTRAWLGLSFAGAWQTANGGVLDLDVDGRLVGVLSWTDRLLPVSYASLPSAAPMTITGNAEKPPGSRTGGETLLHDERPPKPLRCLERPLRRGL